MIDDKKTANVFNKGWLSDIVEDYSSNEVAKDILNMQIVSSEGNTFKLQPSEGTEQVLTILPKYKPNGFGKLLNRVIVFSANESLYGSIGVAYYDESTDLWKFTPIYCHKDLNFSTSNPVQSELSRDNSLIERSYFWDDRNPPRVINVGDPIFYNYILSGSLITDSYYMVVRGTVTYNGSNYGPNETNGTVFQCTSGGGAAYTSAGSALVIDYFPVELLDVTPKINVGQIQFYGWVQNGSLTNRSRKYWYQLEDNSGVRTPWMGESNFVHLTNEVIDNGFITGVESYQNYQGMGGATGSPNNTDINTGKGIELKIENIDTNFSKIRVCVIESVGLNVVTNPIIFTELNITGSIMFIQHMGEESLEEILNEDILTPSVGFLRNRSGKIGHNTFFIGNYKLRHTFDWQASDAVTVRAILKELISDVTDAEFANTGAHPDSTTTLKLVGHGNKNTNKVYENQWYIVEGGTINYDPGTGPIVINDGEVFKPTGNTDYFESISIASGSPSVNPVFRIKMYGDTYRYVKILKDFHDGKGMTADAHVKSYWRGETYRIGIVPVDLWGNDYPVYHCSDFKMPEQSETALNTHEDVAVTDDAGLIKTTANKSHFLKHLGLELDIDFNELANAIVQYNPELSGLTYEDLPKYFKGFKIVRAVRDKQILYQGILRSTWRWEDPITGNEYISPIMGDGNRDSNGADNRDGYVEFAASVVRQPNFYEFFSPDQLLRYGDEAFVAQESDVLKLINYLDDPNRPNPTVGTEHTADQNFYSKYVSNATPLSGMTPISAEANVDPRWTSEYFEGDTPKIASAQWPYFGFGYLVDPSVTPFNVYHKRVAVAGKKLLIYTSADESGTDPDFANGMGYLNSYTFMKPIVNYVKRKSNLYGGNSKEALANTEYITTGHFQLFDQDFMDHLASTNGKAEGVATNIEVWGGDAYVQFFDFNHLIQYGNPSTALHVLNLGLPHGPLSVTPGSVYLFSHSMIFPVESNINIGLREGRHIAKDRSYANGVTNPNGVAYGTGSWDKPETLVYNDAYSCQSTGIVNIGAEVYKSSAIDKENEYRWSKTKSATEKIDSLRQWPVNQVRIADGQSGPITNLLIGFNKLFVIQEQGILYAGINERGMIPDSLGQIITLGTSNIADYANPVDKTFGNKYRLGISEFEKGWLFYDAYNKTIVILTINGESVKASAVMGIDYWIKQHIKKEFITEDNPIDSMGVSGWYDSKNKMAVLTFINGFNTDESSHVSIYYDTLNNQFSGKTNLCPSIAIGYKDLVLCSAVNNKLITENILQTNTSYTAFQSYVLDANNNLYLCILSYTTSGVLLNVQSDTTHWRLINNQNGIDKNYSSAIGRFFGLYYPYYVSFVVNAEHEMTKVFNNQEIIGGENKFFTSVLCNTKDLSGSDLNMDINPLKEYDYFDGVWFTTIPLSANGQRLTGTEMTVKFYNRNYVLIGGVADKSSTINIYTPLTKVNTLYNYVS